MDQYCGTATDLPEQELKQLFADLDVDSSGYIDKNEFSVFVMGEYHALGEYSPVHEGGVEITSRRCRWSSMQPEGRTEAKEAWPRRHGSIIQPNFVITLVERSRRRQLLIEAFGGNIPFDLSHDDTVRTAMESEFGKVDAVQLRRKAAEKPSWAFVVMNETAAAHEAAAGSNVKIGEADLKLEPVALKRELHAKWHSADNPVGAAGDVWRKTVQQTSHGSSWTCCGQSCRRKRVGVQTRSLDCSRNFSGRPTLPTTRSP